MSERTSGKVHLRIGGDIIEQVDRSCAVEGELMGTVSSLGVVGRRRMFEMGADNPQAWRMSADNLLRGARAVASNIRPGPAGTTDVIVSVQAMLIGMAIECALKSPVVEAVRPACDAWSRIHPE